MIKKFMSYDFEYSAKTGRLHNLGLENGLKNLGWIILKPKNNQSKLNYWYKISIDVMTSKSIYMFWMPSSRQYYFYYHFL